MRRKFHWLMIAFLLTLPSQAMAVVVYDTINADLGGGPCFGDSGVGIVGVAVLVPAESSYELQSVTVRLHDVSNSADTPFAVSVYDDDGGLPGSPLAEIGQDTGTWDGDPTFDLYELVPAAPIFLEAGTVYWIVASSPDADTCAFGWTDEGDDPAGSVFAYVDEQQFFDGGWDSQIGDFMHLQIDAIPSGLNLAPVPVNANWALILMGLLLCGVGLSVQWRRTAGL